MAKVTNDVIEVVHHGDALIIPESLPLDRAIKVLMQKKEEEETFTTFKSTVAATPYDGAFAMSKALKKLFGVSIATKTIKQGMFGPVIAPPEQITLEIDALGNTAQVPWGTFEVPGIEGEISATYAQEGNMVVFSINAEIKGKYRKQFEELVAMTKKFVIEESLYRGKAINIEFSGPHPKDANTIIEHPVPIIRFMDVRNAVRPIFSRDIEDQFEHDVLAYIRQSDAIRKLQGGVLKRGVLFAGPYGTGKTLASKYIAQAGEENGFTFLYCVARDVPKALEFAKQYSPAIVFAEDIESIAGIERTGVVTDLLNRLDGVDSKKHSIITIFTTNHLPLINGAMLRPGRMDVLIPVEAPDAEASIKIARMYAGEWGMSESDDFSQSGRELDGMIPAMINEAVKRAQVRALSVSGGASAVIGNDDLYHAARAVLRERNAINPQDKHGMSVQDTIVTGLGALGSGIGVGFGSVVNETLADIAASQRISQQSAEVLERVLLSEAASEMPSASSGSSSGKSTVSSK